MRASYTVYISDCRSVVYPLNIKRCIQPVAIMHQYPITFAAVVDITIGQKAVFYARASIPVMPPSSVPANFCIYKYNSVVACRPSL